MSGKRITCIAGGPSLEGFDFTKVKQFSIGANRAAIEANTSVLVSIDTNFANQCEELLKDYQGEVVLATPNKRVTLEGITYYQRSRQQWIPKDKKTLVGLESGYACVCLAVHLGATHIDLLGYDMNGTSVKRFHNGYIWGNSGGSVPYQQWSKKYKYLKQDLDSRKITVTHYVGPEGSSIDQFETRPLEAYNEP